TGFRSNGQLEGTTGPTPVYPSVYAIGNLFYNVRATNSTTGANCLPYDPTNPYGSGPAAQGWQDYQVYCVDNKITNWDKGISFTGRGYYEVTGNVLANVKAPMSLIPTSWGTNKYDYNFYDPIGQIGYGSATTILSLSQTQANGQEAHSREGSALL